MTDLNPDEKITLNFDKPAEASPSAGSFGIRALATIIDSILLSIVNLPVNYGIRLALAQVGVQAYVVTIVSYLFQTVVQYGFVGFFLTKKGATPGKLVCNLKVINIKTGNNLDWTEVFIREIIGKVLSGIILGIGFLMVIFRKDKRGLHDLIAGSVCLRIKK